MSERLRFVQACLDRRISIAEVCARFGVSEKTGHKWLARFRASGEEGLRDRSHAPHRRAHRLDPALAARIVALRTAHPRWGPEKLRDRLRHQAPECPWPATSTIGELLVREGLVRVRRRRAAAHAQLTGDRTPATAPNVVWTADCKGQFRISSGAYCYPLTLLDLHTHFLLRCRALPSTAVASARAVFADAFTAYGLPEVLRTDNGVPFAQPTAIGRLGALAFWWVRLGIRPEHIRPATPSENGAHERFHRTLDEDTLHPVARTFPGQQRRFDHFEGEYNFERPHASLPDHRPPGQFYTPSPRPYPATLPPLVYADAAVVRRVQAAGAIKWRGHRIFLSLNLAGEDIGLIEIADDCMEIRYASLVLGEFDLHTQQFHPNVHWHAQHPDPHHVPPSPG